MEDENKSNQERSQFMEDKNKSNQEKSKFMEDENKSNQEQLNFLTYIRIKCLYSTDLLKE